METDKHPANTSEELIYTLTPEQVQKLQIMYPYPGLRKDPHHEQYPIIPCSFRKDFVGGVNNQERV